MKNIKRSEKLKKTITEQNLKLKKIEEQFKNSLNNLKMDLKEKASKINKLQTEKTKLEILESNKQTELEKMKEDNDLKTSLAIQKAIRDEKSKNKNNLKKK